MPLGERVREMRALIAPGLLIAFVMTCFYTGIATPTRVVRSGTPVPSQSSRPTRTLSIANLRHSVVQTGRTVAMVDLDLLRRLGAAVGIYTFAGGTTFLHGEIIDLGFGPSAPC